MISFCMYLCCGGQASQPEDHVFKPRAHLGVFVIHNANVVRKHSSNTRFEIALWLTMGRTYKDWDSDDIDVTLSFSSKIEQTN